MRLVPLEPHLREFLHVCPAFVHLSDEALEAIWTRLEQRVYDPQELLMRQGDVGESLMLLVSGSARGFVQRAAERHHIADLGSGDVVGEMALVTREPRTADVVAVGQTCVLALKADDFQDVARDHPGVGVVLTRLVADRLGNRGVDGLGGKVIDRYRIHSSVGRGAMAAVYDAEDLETGQRVALKMMSHRLIYEEGALARFRREADLLLELEHPNVARVYRRFPALKTNFIAMEFCEGRELSALIEAEGALPEERARRLIGQLAAGLAYLHGEGIIHRDLKPSNVMVTDDDLVKLTDFGLAKSVEAEVEAPLTTARSLLGTPLYMAPEQMAGHGGDLLTDAYSFGCLAYELVSGGPIFQAKTLFELQEEKQRLAVPWASELGVSDELHAVLVSALAAERDQRHLDLGRLAGWA